MTIASWPSCHAVPVGEACPWALGICRLDVRFWHLADLVRDEPCRGAAPQTLALSSQAISELFDLRSARSSPAHRVSSSLGTQPARPWRPERLYCLFLALTVWRRRQALCPTRQHPQSQHY